MKFDDLSTTQQQKIQIVSERLSKKYGYDFKNVLKDPLSLKEHTSSIKEKMKIIETRTKFGDYQKRSEWQRLNLILEGLMALNEKKGAKVNSVEDSMDKTIANQDKNKEFKDRKPKGQKAGKKPKHVSDKAEADQAKKDRLKKARLAKNESKMHRFAMITESELERAELVLAAQDIVDGLQNIIEELSKTKVEKLSPLVDRLKAEHGLEAAEQYNTAVSAQLDTALDTVTNVKDLIDTESKRITGDVDPNAVADMNDSPPEDGEELDLGEPNIGDEELNLGEPEELDLGEPEEVERELKESKITISLKTKAGKTGKKFFESKKAMRRWLNENEDKIAKVTKITEAKC